MGSPPLIGVNNKGCVGNCCKQKGTKNMWGLWLSKVAGGLINCKAVKPTVKKALGG